MKQNAIHQLHKIVDCSMHSPTNGDTLFVGTRRECETEYAYLRRENRSRNLSITPHADK